jgi:CubicO group peptidase (beta-lactamase class C family)
MQDKTLPTAPGLFAVFAVALLPSLCDVSACRADDPTAAAGKTGPLAPVLQPFVDRDVLAGAVVLVADKDKVLDVEAIGLADIAGKRPMLFDILFWIASQSKPITAAALMMLVDEGKLKLDDPVEKYLPEFRGQWLAVESDKDHILLKRPHRPVTVRDVLRHTSGMAFRSALEQPTLDQLPLKVAVASYAITPLQYEPGSKYQYSNAGINTAGRIIEVVSGMSYEDFLQQRLFDPLGMKDTTFWPSEAQVKRLAKSYRPGPGKKGLEEITVSQLHYPLSDRKRQPVPAGGLFSTADDLGRFCRMVLSDGVFEGKRYLSPAAVKEMTTRQTPPEIKEGYGLGWATGDGGYGHGGAYATNMNIDAKRGLITIFLVQHAGFPGDGDRSQAAFRRAAEEHFAKTK